MDTEALLLDGATCAASDLTARLLAELARVERQLADAEARALAAIVFGRPVPADAEVDRVAGRQHVAALHEVLAGMPITIPGARHVACV